MDLKLENNPENLRKEDYSPDKRWIDSGHYERQNRG